MLADLPGTSQLGNRMSPVRRTKAPPAYIGGLSLYAQSLGLQYWSAETLEG